MQPHSHSVFLLLADPLDSAETAYHLTLANSWVLVFVCLLVLLFV